jgi:hypothetical protein
MNTLTLLSDAKYFEEGNAKFAELRTLLDSKHAKEKLEAMKVSPFIHIHTYTHRQFTIGTVDCSIKPHSICSFLCGLSLSFCLSV